MIHVYIESLKVSYSFLWRGCSITPSEVCLNDEVNSKMPRTKSKAVPEGNGSVPHDEYGSGELTKVKLYRVLKVRFDRSNKHLNNILGG